MYDNRFFDFMMQNEALKKTMLLNKVALIIFEAFRMWQETMGDIFPPNVPSNVPSNVNSARIDCYANILMGEIEDVLTPNQDVILVDIHDNGFNYKLVNLLKNRYPELAIIYPCYRYTVAGPIFEKFRFY